MGGNAIDRSQLPPTPGSDEYRSLDLANSVVVLPQGGSMDALASPQLATSWLIDHDLAGPDTQLKEFCTNRLRDLRGTIRSIFGAATTATAPEASALADLNRALHLTPAVENLHWEQGYGFFCAPDHPTTQVVEYAITALAADAIALLTGPMASTLASCAATPCNRYFLRTHARRTWCSTRCGNRVRAARSYTRHREPTSSRPEAP